jgi:hypothetical protein
LRWVRGYNRIDIPQSKEHAAMTTPNKDRAAFMLWRKERTGYPPYPHEHNELAAQWDKGAWEGFQAACAEKDKVIAELERVIEVARSEAYAALVLGSMDAPSTGFVRTIYNKTTDCLLQQKLIRTKAQGV